MIKGSKHSGEAKLKMSQVRKGKRLSEEHRKKLSEALNGNLNSLGHHQSDEHKRKTSEAHTGPKNYWYGKHLSKEHRQKIGNAHTGQTGTKSPTWKGGRYKERGRWLIFKPEHPFAPQSRYIRRSRLVIEQVIGRYLKPNEIVHHINSIVDDDRPENLKLFFNRAAHVKCHSRSKHCAS